VQEMVEGNHGKGLQFSKHQSLRFFIPQIWRLSVAILCTYLFEYYAAKLLGIGWRDSIPVFGGLSFRWLSIVPLCMFFEIVRKYHDHLFVFERERVVHHLGLLSLTYNVPSVRYFDIRALQVNQGLLGRLLNFGDIELSTAAQDRAEVIIKGVYAPLALAQFIDEMRSWHHGGGDDFGQVDESRSSLDAETRLPFLDVY
jgi:membrane protein YdbS with pleckstrin-like domain